MAHLQRAQPDATWVRGYITLGSDLATIDQNTFVAINGDAGGTWTPSADIVVGGAGMIAAGPWTFSGAGCTVDTNGTTALMTFGKGTADDVFGLATSMSTTLTQLLLDYSSPFPESWLVSYWSTNGAPGAAASLAGLALSGLLATVNGARFIVPLRTYNGATAETVSLAWAVVDSHANPPQVLPRMRVMRIDASGVVTPLRAPDSLTDADGFQALSTATTGAVYFNSGNRQTFVYTCNQNNVIDLASFTYFIEVVDESGSGGWTVNGTIYFSAATLYDNISLIDGRA